MLRQGTAAGRHVHLHPARYAARTIRVKANVLKTAMAALIAAGGRRDAVTLELVNQVRAQWLALPPIQEFGEDASASKLLKLLLG